MFKNQRTTEISAPDAMDGPTRRHLSAKMAVR